MNVQKFVDDWHELVDSRNIDRLDDFLDDDAVLISPIVHAPQEGKAITTMYLHAALLVFANDTFKYKREFLGANSAVLEFETQIEGVSVNGVDMITLNDAGKITEFRVMVRPLQAIQLIHKMMGSTLEDL